MRPKTQINLTGCDFCHVLPRHDLCQPSCELPLCVQSVDQLAGLLEIVVPFPRRCLLLLLSSPVWPSQAYYLTGNEVLMRVCARASRFSANTDVFYSPGPAITQYKRALMEYIRLPRKAPSSAHFTMHRVTTMASDA